MCFLFCFAPFFFSSQFLQIHLNWCNIERWVIQVLMLPSMCSQKLLLPQCWPFYKDTISPDSIDYQRIRCNFFFFFFLQSVFKAFNKHITDFQKLVASLGQIHCMVCHIHLPSIYVRKWQVKLAHTTINPCVHSFLLIPHCTVTIRYAIKTQIPSTQLCGDLLHKQLLEGIKHSTNVVTLLPPVWRQKPYHSSAMLYSHITSLLHVLVLL